MNYRYRRLGILRDQIVYAAVTYVVIHIREINRESDDTWQLLYLSCTMHCFFDPHRLFSPNKLSRSLGTHTHTHTQARRPFTCRKQTHNAAHYIDMGSHNRSNVWSKSQTWMNMNLRSKMVNSSRRVYAYFTYSHGHHAGGVVKEELPHRFFCIFY